MSGRHGGRNESYGDSNRHGAARISGREGRDPRDERTRKDPKSQSRPIREEPMDVDMDDNSDGPGPYTDRHTRTRDTYAGAAPIGRTTTQTATAGTRRHREQDSPDEPERSIIDLPPSSREQLVQPGSDRAFWIPNEGIEREVIQYEITRYLGQDALVRPGKNEVGFAHGETV